MKWTQSFNVGNGFCRRTFIVEIKLSTLLNSSHSTAVEANFDSYICQTCVTKWNCPNFVLCRSVFGYKIITTVPAACEHLKMQVLFLYFARVSQCCYGCLGLDMKYCSPFGRLCKVNESSKPELIFVFVMFQLMKMPPLKTQPSGSLSPAC